MERNNRQKAGDKGEAATKTTNSKSKFQWHSHAADLTRRCDSPVPAAVGAHRAQNEKLTAIPSLSAQTVESLKATTTGIDTYPLEFVPAVTLTPDPQQIMVPAERASQPLTLLTRVRYHGTKPAKVSVGLDAPKGWQLQPIAPLDFSGPGDQLIRFSVTPSANVVPGAYPLHPFAQLDGEKFTTSLEPIPSLPTRDWSEPADVTVHVLNLIVPAHLRVGYIAASNDPIPDTLRQIGIQVDLLDEVALAFEDLSRYDAIVVGIRAYDLRPDLMRSNRRLLDYVQQGGSLVVQYQRDPQWVSAMPYTATMPGQTSRVTDANSPCTSSRPIIRWSIHRTKSRSPISKAGTRSAASISSAHSIRTINRCSASPIPVNRKQTARSSTPTTAKASTSTRAFHFSASSRQAYQGPIVSSSIC